MEIVLGSGVDDIVFGLTETQIIEQLGSPNKIWVTEFNDRELSYYEQQLVLKIEAENDHRLGWIEVHNRGATLWGNNLWETPREQLLELLTSKLGEDYEFEDYSSFECYSFYENWVELQFGLGRLRCCNFGVLYGENDQPLWPESKI
ncbi:MAG: hypothetical protein F6J87_25725 [Spirulina sp. SIO3F2]|nr:hypothetical protein [Spirulina sp. SIO3F2]